MKSISYLLKLLLLGFLIVPLAFSLLTSTIEFYTAPEINSDYETFKKQWATFFSAYFWFTISYYSYFFFFGLVFFEYVKLVMKSFTTKDSISFKVGTNFIYFVLFQFAALKITNINSDLFHYGNTNLKMVILVLVTSALFSWIYHLLFRKSK
ncbi:MAG: hypothetical protein ACK4S0_07675 [Sediminibacterium sp.]